VGFEVALDALLLGRHAGHQARKQGFPNNTDGPTDALRHCIWSCYLTEQFGSTTARIITDIHERCAFTTWDAQAMDLFNNVIGRDIEERFGDCTRNCVRALLSHQLIDLTADW
jgi:hypothetical protein